MAMVLDAFASYLQRTLMEMAKEEVYMLFRVTGEMEKMGDKLGDLKNFLADADRRNIRDKTVQAWVGQLKRAMYEATDILDLCQLKAMKRVPSRADEGCFNPVLFCLRNPLHAHDISTRIKALNETLDTIKQRGEAFNFANLDSYEDRGASTVHGDGIGRPNRESSGELDRSGVVGEKIEEDTRALVAKIMQPRNEVNENLMVVAIVGVGGIGKTTLAQKLFNDETIQSEFTKKIWLSVNKDFRESELLKRAITEAEGDDQPAGDAKTTLQRTLKHVLTGHKTLLVLDDVWSQEAWESVLKTPLVNAVARGSLVLVTTRDERVARRMKAVLPYQNVEKLDNDNAWALLKKQVVSSEKDGAEIDMLKDIGLQIVEKCGGLPLTVKVVGGLLCQKGKQRHDWEMVLNDSIWSVSDMPQELNYAIYLSYEDLSPCIKQCFLYYSLLPKSVQFHKDKIISMWISEGFVHGTSNDLEDLGREHYKELILRNLIEPKKGFADQSICTMHDVVRSFAQFVARDEALAVNSEETDNIAKLSAHQFLRLSLESSESEWLDWSSLQKQKTLRTLISSEDINMEPGDSLVDFPCLRTLNMDRANSVAFVDSLHKLKHLRYLSIEKSDISSLPNNIRNMKLLQYISLSGCKQFVRLPHSIVELRQLRSLNIEGTAINVIPRGFCALTNLRSLEGFPSHEDGDWCSLEELGPLSELRILGLRGLENVSGTLSATKARLDEKVHLSKLSLICSTLGNDRVINEVEQQQIEEVFDELCPPACSDYLTISGYFGRRFPRWMMSSSDVPLKYLRVLFMADLACCTQLPDGLCQIPCLEFIQIKHAPSIKRIGPEFLQPYYHPAMAMFPRLHEMNLVGMVEWEEWEWDEQVEAFPVLEELLLMNCKLTGIPPALAFHAKALRKITLSSVRQINSLEMFASLVELNLYYNYALKRITNLPNLQKLTIVGCKMMKVLEGVPALQRLVLKDYTMEKLPEYMRGIKPKHFELFCRPWLLASVAKGQSGPEWEKFSHVEDVKAYASNADYRVEWYVLYTRDPCNLETNIRLPTMSRETLSSSMVGARGFECVFKMRRSTFSYICSLVRLPFLEDMMGRDHTFNDGRVLSLQDRVAVALIMLNSGESLETVGSSIGVNESTVSLVTNMFLEAMIEQANQHAKWPNSSVLEKIKSKFDKIHGLPNCCGVLHTSLITFVSTEPNSGHGENDSILAQTLVDPHMRFTNVSLAEGSNDKSSILQESYLFKRWKTGIFLNGSKLKVSDGSEIGEYIIGDAGHPLLPWLITPYQEENLSYYKVEFNRRHSTATTVAVRALATLKDTWKFLHGQAWRLQTIKEVRKAFFVCCRLHNIVIDMEEGFMPNGANFNKKMRPFIDEDAARARDILSQHLISRPSASGGTLSIFEDTQGFESAFKMTRTTFNYVCNLVRVPSLEDMSSYTFVDGRAMCTEDLVAIALRVLNSGEPLETIACSVGVKESTVFLVTWTFINAMLNLPIKHFRWPETSEMAMIKANFDKIYGLPNCCGTIHTTNLKICRLSSEPVNSKKNASLVMQAVVGPDMRFLDISLLEPGTCWNQSSILLTSNLFRRCMKGELLNLSSDGSEVREHIIGDAGYPLLPWLITPYQEENLSYCAAEFNMRQSTATTSTMRALTRFKETWKFSYGEVWRPNSMMEQAYITIVCCMLHNIVIDMDDDAATVNCEASMPNDHDMNYRQQVCRFTDENAVRVRDILSRHLNNRPSQSGGTFSFFEDAKMFESVFKMTRRTFNYLSSLMELWSPQHMSWYTFLDGRVLSLDDKVAIALIMLNSGEPQEVIGTSVGMEESTVWQVTWGFVDAILELASHHVRWPDTDEMEMIKSKFDRIHGFPNCCGVLHTIHIKMNPSSHGPNYEIWLNNENNYSTVLHVVVDPHMRFRSFGIFPGSCDGSTIMQKYDFFKLCEKGELLNGSKIKVSSDGPEVGEYIIGDATNPLLPWLITPYQLQEDPLDSKARFNRRHTETATTTLSALTRMKDTWKLLNATMMWHPNNVNTLHRIIDVCCVLHNIVIDMEGDAALDEAPVRSDQEVRHNPQVRQLAEEDAVMARDVLAQHLTSRSSGSGDHTTSCGTVASAGTSAGALATNYRYRWQAGLMALSIFVVLVGYLIKCMTEVQP